MNALQIKGLLRTAGRLLAPVLLLAAGGAARADEGAAPAPLIQPLPSGAVRELGYLALRDGTRLSYVAYYPRDAKARPVLLTFTPYGGGSLDERDARPYLDRGYAFVGVDIRGTNCSTGRFSLFDPVLGDDGKQVVETIGARRWSNRSVGMIGMSYPGHTQIFTAARHPKYLKAIAPGAVTADVWREAFAAQGLFNTAMTGGWAFGISHRELAERRVAWGDTECDLDRAAGQFAPAFDEVKDHLLVDDWRTPRRLDSHIADVAIPTMIVGAWQDHVTQSTGAIHLYRKLRAPRRLLMQTGGHFVYNDRDIVREEVLRWMDHWLMGKANGVEKEPVKIFWEVHDRGGKATPNWTSVHSGWPDPAVRPAAYFLTGDGALAPQASAGAPARRSYVSPSATEFTGDNIQFALAPQPSGSLFYRTAPMERDTAILGLPQLRIFLSSSQADTDLMFVLHDIDPGGNTTFVQRAIMRASLRAIDTRASTADEQVFALREMQKLEPGKVYELKLSMPPVAQVIRKGHRLELGIMSPPGIGTPSWGFALIDAGGRNSVHHSPLYPSSIVIPVASGISAAAPPPPCGAIEFQPCRPPAPAAAW